MVTPSNRAPRYDQGRCQSRSLVLRTQPVAAALLMISLLALPSAVHARDAFLGKWKVTVSPEEGGQGKEFKDTLEFKGGKFSAETFNKLHKFEAVTYEEDT